MASQAEHLAALHPSYQNIVEMVQDLAASGSTDKNIDELREELLKLGTSIQGLDLRLLNDDLAARISEGSSRAVGALASKFSPHTLHNRNAANSVNGVQIDNTDIIRLFESIDFYEAPETPGRSVNVLFHDCLALLTAMFTDANQEENEMLRALATRVTLPKKSDT